MKKIFSLLLAVLMTLSFCACGASSDFKAESTADYSYAEPAAAPAVGMMAAEVRAMRLVREQTSVPVARVYAYDTSRTLCSSDYFYMEALTRFLTDWKLYW